MSLSRYTAREAGVPSELIMSLVRVMPRRFHRRAMSVMSSASTSGPVKPMASTSIWWNWR